MESNKVSLLEAVEVFGKDAVPVLNEKAWSLNEDEEKTQALLDLKVAAAKRSYQKYDEFVSWFLTRIATYRTASWLARIKKERKSIDRAMLLLNKGENKDWERKVETARQIPIEELFAGKLRKVSRSRFVGLCPLHQEKTPSFTIYTHNNSWYCFGCNQGGDSLDLLMRLENLEFKVAVRRLA
ncbi:MAG: CHC2 zinc finger domain-containing protein [bacterium]|nr:CHC2 zinc finger domain-containing protein [bacterium]